MSIARVRAASLLIAVCVGASLLPLLPSQAQTAAEPFIAEGTIENPSTGPSVTRSDFLLSCPSIPESQGFDGWVFEIPQDFPSDGAQAVVTGSNATNNYNLNLGIWNRDCSFDENVSNPDGPDVIAELQEGNGFVLVQTSAGFDTAVTLSATPGGAGPSPTPTSTGTSSPSPSPTGGTGGSCGTYPEVPNDRWFQDPGFINPGGQWGMRTIGAPQTWEHATGCGIKVAVLDTGIDVGNGSDLHPDFRCDGKVEILPGTDFIQGDNLPNDQNGHGTHVAGIVGACTNNGEGVVGVAPDVTILPIRVLDANGDGTAPGLVQGIRKATASGAHVINMSLGFASAVAPAELLFEVFPDINDAIEDARAAGVVVVAAAGNETFPLCAHPAIAEDVICVGASDPRDLNAGYGNFPVKLDENEDFGPGLLAPGGTGTLVFCQQEDEDIISAYLRAGDTCGEVGYQAIAGTSMASPHVAGLAALVYERLNGARTAANGRAIIDAIINNTVDLYAPGYDPASGYGRLDALAAVQSVGAGPTPTPSPTPTVTDTSVTFAGTTPASGQFTDSISLSATLEDENGTPLPDEDLTFQLLGRDGFREIGATTGPDGSAGVELPLDAPPGDYDLIVGYAGKTGTYNSSSDNRPFEILREDSAAEIKVEGKGGKKTITGKLLDADSSHPVRNGVLAFYANGEFIGEGLTNELGEIRFEVPAGHRGNNTTYEVRFVGNTFFEPSSASTTG